MPPEPILHLEGFALVKRFGVSFQAGAQIFGVDIFHPTISQFCMNGATREFQPRLIEIHAKLVRTSHPDQHRSGVCYQPETLFTLAQSSLCLLAESDVPDDDGKQFLSASFCLRNRGFNGKFLTSCAEAAQGAPGSTIRNTSLRKMSDIHCMPRTEAFRDEAADVSADRVASLTGEHLFRGRVENDDPLILVDGDDGVHGRLDNTLQAVLALPKLLQDF